MLKRLTFLCLLGVAIACRPTSDSPTDLLVNHWDMDQIIHNGQDATQEHDPEDNRWIELYDDGTYTSDGDPYGRNTGKWTLNEETMELYLDSDAGEGDDSYWIVEVAEDSVRLSGARSEFTKAFVMTWKAAVPS
jgi:hypothetical protein